MKPTITRTTQLTVLPQGETIFSEMATRITIEDEAAGEFLLIVQDHSEAKPGTISIDPKDWPAMREAIELLMEQIQEHGTEPQEIEG